jgi:hypothetical protein
MMIYHFLYVLWFLLAILSFHSVVLASVVATYYWTRDKDMIESPVSSSFKRTLRYHLGSVFFGAAILTAVKCVKWAMQYMTRKLSKFAGGNPLIKFLVCCLHCCICLFEKFIKFLTKNAYIMIAVDGKSFCGSAGQAWSLLMSNIARMTAVNVVTAYLFLMAKIGIAFMCAAATTYWIERKLVYDESNTSVSSPFAPSVFAFFLGYFVASVFFEVSDFTIDTLLLCFCLDDLKNAQSGNYYATTRLLRFMAKSHQKKAAKAKK